MSISRSQETEAVRQQSEADDGFEKPRTRISEMNLDAGHPALSDMLSARDNKEKRKTPPLLKVQTQKEAPSPRKPRKVVHQEFTEELISSLPSIADMMQQSRGKEKMRGTAIVLGGIACGGLVGGVLYILLVGL